MSKDFYTEVKDNKDKFPKQIVALCGFCATYNAKWFGGYAGIVHTKIGTEGIPSCVHEPRLLSLFLFS